MTSSPGVIYEVTHAIAQDTIGDFDDWLRSHIEEMLTLPGFIKARSFKLDDDERGWARRVTHYHLETEADLESYLQDSATAMRQTGTDRFGDRLEAKRRILHAAPAIGAEALPVEHCLNCRAILAGQYCANCGQRSRSRLISLWELISDAFGDLFELDSRLWRTLIPLVVRPGMLTKDYLEGRRARFMPPFRTYLVLSIFFFLVAFFDPKQDLQILFEPDETPSSTVEPAGDETDVRDAADVAQQVLDELDSSGVEINDADRKKLQEVSKGINIQIADQNGEPGCQLDGFDEAQLPQWLAKRLTKKRLIQVCEKIQADSGRDFSRKQLDYVPAALFFLLPLMALILKILYPLSKRYYVEHLLFVVHFHAFFFLILTLQVLFSRLGHLVSIPDAPIQVTVVAVALYIPVYLYKAMRRVYGQRHLITVPKYLMLIMAYVIGIALVMLVATLIAAFSM